jgi:hypothetical protein
MLKLSIFGTETPFHILTLTIRYVSPGEISSPIG